MPARLVQERIIEDLIFDDLEKNVSFLSDSFFYDPINTAIKLNRRLCNSQPDSPRIINCVKTDANDERYINVNRPYPLVLTIIKM